MRLLLDTHTFLWFITGNSALSAKARTLIEDSANAVWVSPASLWDIAIKMSVGKLTLIAPFQTLIPQQMIQNNIGTLEIKIAHTATIITLPYYHRDPFDRMIIAQAMVLANDNYQR